MTRLFTIWVLGMALHQTSAADSPDPATPDSEQNQGLPGMVPFEAPPDPQTATARTEVIAKSLRCPVCQALSVADSSSDAARTMKSRIHELVLMGYNQEQITDYFVDRYGEWVRLEPEAKGLNWLIWMGPMALMAGGGLFIGLRARGSSDTQEQSNKAPTEPAPSPSHASPPASSDGTSTDPYRDQILAELTTSKNTKGDPV